MQTIIQGNYGTMYYVQDMKKATAFYAVLGMKARYESAEWTEYDLGDGTALCLHGIDPNGKAPSTKGGILITKVKDIRDVVAGLKGKGYEFVKDVGEVHPGAYSASFLDPSGNVVSLYEDTSA